MAEFSDLVGDALKGTVDVLKARYYSRAGATSDVQYEGLATVPRMSDPQARALSYGADTNPSGGVSMQFVMLAAVAVVAFMMLKD